MLLLQEKLVEIEDVLSVLHDHLGYSEQDAWKFLLKGLDDYHE